jgi:hypothetical protein
LLPTKKISRLSSYNKTSQTPTEVSKENSEIWSWTHREKSCPEEAGLLCGCLGIWGKKFFFPEFWDPFIHNP